MRDGQEKRHARQSPEASDYLWTPEDVAAYGEPTLTVRLSPAACRAIGTPDWAR